MMTDSQTQQGAGVPPEEYDRLERMIESADSPDQT